MHEPVEHPEHEHPEHEHHRELVEAAIEAELETGAAEETVEQAKRHIVVRLARMTVGFVVLVLGILAIPLPGPGWLIVALGLGILARDFVWAERTVNLVRKRLPQDADGKIPPRTIAMIGVVTTVTVGASVWWSFLR